ncbi:precorrin-6A reductase [Clostridium cibarium]|uniref:Precorrin-6A reductase n=1 Tax=Clostridium cibarium TaxID=2762247 RepID=A0ABR8PXX4_9CLOT|nr:precorrin-6A reductase [Clostridium cibarium]MBD7912984.1 precorrin-6A reductase [Clostridium cibarium]
MYNILVFAGTTEGREIISYLVNNDINIYACVATEYGEKLLVDGDNIKVSSKPLNEEEMISLMERERFDLVIDATHPYAVEVSKNVISACKNTKTEYLRLIRSSEEGVLSENIVYVNSVDEAVNYLKDTVGNVFVATGSKELAKFTALDNYKERIYARVLSTTKVVDECTRLGFEGKHLICMQGPFSEELNYVMFKHTLAKYMVTKESGKVGGFSEKVLAASKAGAKSIVIGRPMDEEGFSYLEVVKIINKGFLENKPKRKVCLVGIGMGNLDSLTREGQRVFEEADVIIGAKRMLEALKSFNKPTFNSYKYDEIVNFVENHLEYNSIAIALSGDIGFFSGAKSLLENLKDYEVHAISGVSSLSYFSSKLGVSWDDVKLLSLHGREENFLDAVKHNKKTFLLLGGDYSPKKICEELVEYGLGNLEVAIAENLSYENEKIHKGLARGFISQDFDSLSVMLIDNDKFIDGSVTHGIVDEEFIRGEVPMTKSEVRAISISKISLNEDSIVYDIGAGTGSVAIEMALRVGKGKIFAIEKNPKAIELLKRNKKKFMTSNLEVIEGVAPNMMEKLPPPTRAFIGGTSGNLRSIIGKLLEKNPKVKIVLNAITLETISEAIECIKEFNLVDVEIVQVAISKGKALGKYNMMIGQNPIYIITCKGDDMKWGEVQEL